MMQSKVITEPSRESFYEQIPSSSVISLLLAQYQIKSHKILTNQILFKD